MSSRVPVLAIATLLPVISAAVILGAGHPSLSASGATVEFQDGVGNPVASYMPGEIAAFHIEGANLGALASSTATWSQISAKVPSFSLWSLATGAPEAGVFALSSGMSYDTTSPENTPLYSVLTATVGATNPPLSDCNALTGEFSMANDVNAASTLQVDFVYYVEDSHSSSQHRASVTSTSDTDGEWVAIAAVVSVSGTGVCPSAGLYPPPGLFGGDVLLSGNVATSASGDGAVWVQANDTLTVTYYDSDGVPVDSDHATMDSTPTPPVPIAGPLLLGALGAVFALLAAWRFRR